jgi:RimJ/RimL family protein N-acetyltransferase
MRWLGGIQSMAALRRDVGYFINAERRDGFTFWVVELMPQRTFLGFCGLLTIRERDCPFKGNVEVGWRIRQDAWRNGFAFEAASAVLAHAFKRLRLPEIVSRVSGGNTASRKLMAKLGLRRRRDLDYRPRGDNSKFMVYSIDAEQWRRAGERP